MNAVTMAERMSKLRAASVSSRLLLLEENVFINDCLPKLIKKTVRIKVSLVVMKHL
jgi:hypothetical protein